MFVLKGKCYFRGISQLPNVILHKPSKHSTKKDGLKMEQHGRDESGEERSFQENRERTILTYNSPPMNWCTYPLLSMALYFHDGYHDSIRTIKGEIRDWEKAVKSMGFGEPNERHLPYILVSLREESPEYRITYILPKVRSMPYCSVLGKLI